MGKVKVVIIGGGFGGLEAAKKLAGSALSVTLIDKRNYHLFQPLLYQVATAGLSSTQVAAPIRSLLKRGTNCQVILGEVIDIDINARKVITKENQFYYDYLIVATGAETNYFGKQEWEAQAPSLKNIADATAIRKKILLSFEKAESQTDSEKRRSLLNFVIVGGGPTGVELAGAIRELATMSLRKDFRQFDPRSCCVYLVEAGTRLLSTFDPKLSHAAEKKLKKMGVELRLGERVKEITNFAVVTDKSTIPSATVLWAAGVKATPAAQWLKLTEDDRSGRIAVDEHLNLPADKNIFVIGDLAKAKDLRNGGELPGVAPVALQQGRYVARVILRRLNGKKTGPFLYFDKGMLATIGRTYAVGEIRGLKFRGFVAWILWATVHILYLIGFRNRLFVILDWLWAYATYQRSARIIIEDK